MINLQQIKIASPCHVGWHNMQGDDKVRFCDSCQKHVYNFSEMTLEEGAALILAKDGNLCGHLSRRDDGTIITKDCPVGLANKIYRRCLYAILAALLDDSFDGLDSFQAGWRISFGKPPARLV